MLRISHTSTTEAQVTVRLEGEISGRWVEELRRECLRHLEDATNGGMRLVLDLAEVLSVDASGLALFRELSTHHVAVRNCSLYLTELLKEVTHVES